MWLVYALSAAVIWGISYAASGRVIERGVSATTFYLCYLLFGFLAIGGTGLVSGRLANVLPEIRSLGGDGIWLAVALAASTAGGLLIFLAIGEKNATLASLIEISYPLFVAMFAWIFFREAHLNWLTGLGAALILGGVVVVYLGNRH